MNEPLSDAARFELLWKLFDALLLHLVAALEKPGPVKASMLDVVRHFLAMNNITMASRADAKRGLTSLAEFRALPFTGEKKPS